ncbi:hypothetical protein [Nocardia vermiculata]|uniref:Uncharacterized protein n=1 Tax=Nocardia vermiculata TaxID=257274 RepID=A0A846Y2A1_9NOCA|nr:hypothetical protein [Nocardia vermiculata]NKY53626.1 hypothetical protein [Nocardia vermiculata]
MRPPPIADTFVSTSGICEHSVIDLAHALMQVHRDCRVQHCAWKQVAYRTLVHYRRLQPPRWSPRERAHLRGVEFPVSAADYSTFTHNEVPVATFEQVLAGLNELANDARHHDRSDR